jgi:hypothetical protein
MNNQIIHHACQPRNKFWNDLRLSFLFFPIPLCFLSERREFCLLWEGMPVALISLGLHRIPLSFGHPLSPLLRFSRDSFVALDVRYFKHCSALRVQGLGNGADNNNENSEPKERGAQLLVTYCRPVFIYQGSIDANTGHRMRC